jgi:hypothetical protein
MSRGTGTASVGGGKYAASHTFTLGTGAGATAFYQPHKITTEGPDLRGLTISFSVWVNTAVANGLRAYIYSDGTGAGFTTTSTTGGPQVLRVTRTVPTDATLVTVGIQFTASCTGDIDNAMLVVGSQAADYAPLHPADDLARCQRYYEKFSGIATRWYAQNTAVTQEVIIPVRAILAVTPTVTITAGSRANVAGGYPTGRFVASDSVVYSYAPTATGDTYALNEIYVIEANP